MKPLKPQCPMCDRKPDDTEHGCTIRTNDNQGLWHFEPCGFEKLNYMDGNSLICGDYVSALRQRGSLRVFIRGVVQEVRLSGQPIVFLENPEDPRMPYGALVDEYDFELVRRPSNPQPRRTSDE